MSSHSTVGARGLPFRLRTRLVFVVACCAASVALAESSEGQCSGGGLDSSPTLGAFSSVIEGVFGRSSATGLDAFALRTSIGADPLGPQDGGFAAGAGADAGGGVTSGTGWSGAADGSTESFSSMSRFNTAAIVTTGGDGSATCSFGSDMKFAGSFATPLQA